MSFAIKNQLEKIFRESASSDELFDTFQQALSHRLIDADLYKILLGNMALSVDEIKMFTDKLCTEFKDISYDLYLWAGNILENMSDRYNIENAFHYYKKAIDCNPQEYTPYSLLVRMYNPELDIPPKHNLLNLFERGLAEVKSKSYLCKTIAGFYKKLENQVMEKKYMAMAAKYSRQGI